MKTRSVADRLVDDYLDELDRELAGIPATRRHELADEIDDHIELARSELEGGGTEAEVRTLLDRLGDPAAIAADAAEGSVAPAAPPRRGWVEGLALVLLPVGGLILPFAGWFVGVVLLWSSHAWRTRDKLLGTLVLPFGLLPAFLVLGMAGLEGQVCSSRQAPDGRITQSCTGGPTTLEAVSFWALVAFMVIAPILTAIHLGRRLRPDAQAAASA
jgi:hypothetical protein